MIFDLQSVLDLRRDAENNAKQALALASDKLRSEEEEQVRLATRCEAAEAALDAEISRLAQGPATAEQGLARESYLRRLREEALRLKSTAHEHAATALAAARSLHEGARRDYEAAVRDRDAVAKLEQRAKAAARKAAARRAEDEAMELATHRRR